MLFAILANCFASEVGRNLGGISLNQHAVLGSNTKTGCARLRWIGGDGA